MALQYHTEKDEIKYMSAYVDSVQSGTYRIVRQDNVLRVYYTMGFDPESIFLPMVFTEEVFEQRIKANLNGSQNRQLAKHYALYSPENKGDDFADKLKDYPALEHQALYIYTSSYDMVTVKSVASLMQKAGYTAEEYESDTADLEVESSGLMPGGFCDPAGAGTDRDRPVCQSADGPGGNLQRIRSAGRDISAGVFRRCGTE